MATFIPVKELLALYASGWFPMGMPDGTLRCFSPDPRGIIPLETPRVPHGTRRLLRQGGWEVRMNGAFEEVIRACAGRAQTWIDESIVRSYLALHCEGHAHSIEVWRENRLAGGLYGVTLGAAFFGESMFHRVSGASKIALVHLVRRLREAGFQLLDVQWRTPHLVQFGAVEISRATYLRLLETAVRRKPSLAP